MNYHDHVYLLFAMSHASISLKGNGMNKTMDRTGELIGYQHCAVTVSKSCVALDYFDTWDCW